jgi:hypothetical protein
VLEPLLHFAQVVGQRVKTDFELCALLVGHGGDGRSNCGIGSLRLNLSRFVSHR